jgi:hypothetical protein
MPHLYNNHEGVMIWDDWDDAMELSENFWHALQVATTFDVSSMIKGQ